MDKIYAIIDSGDYHGEDIRCVFTTISSAIKGVEEFILKKNSIYTKIRDKNRWQSGPYFIEIVEWPIDKLFV